MGAHSRPQRTRRPSTRALEARYSTKPARQTKDPGKATNDSSKTTRTSSAPRKHINNASESAQEQSGSRRSARIASHANQMAPVRPNPLASNRRQSTQQDQRPKKSTRPSNDQPRGYSQQHLGLLANIYKEIDSFANRDESKLWANGEQKRLRDEMSAIHRILRQARTFRFLDLAGSRRRGALQRRLKALSSNKESVTKAIETCKADLAISQEVQRRLTDFCDEPNLFILSVCAHSQTFRNAIYRSDQDSHDQGLPAWDIVLAMIRFNASSLELFARIRDLKWQTALDFEHKHFDVLLEGLDGRCKVEGVNGGNFGIGPVDECQIHEIGSDRKQGHWFLPREVSPAKRSKVKITLSACTLDEYKQKLQDIELDCGSEIDVIQEDIDESVVLSGHTYPAWVQSLNAHQPTDPRFCGYPGFLCEACKAYGSEAQTAKKLRACTCKLRELQYTKRQSPQILFELVSTERMGTGVRALQGIKSGDYIGEYLGEIYPLRNDDQGHAISRYGNSLYIFDLEVIDPVKRPRHSFRVDAVKLGNWTRYINHSCQPNSSYTIVNIGQLQAITIKAEKDIGFGEELTIDYGNRYFKNVDFGCKCGLSKCKLWPETQGRKASKNLRQAKRAGSAPSWAMKDDNVPFDAPIARGTLGIVNATGGKRTREVDHHGSRRRSKRIRRE